MIRFLNKWLDGASAHHNYDNISNEKIQPYNLTTATIMEFGHFGMDRRKIYRHRGTNFSSYLMSSSLSFF